MSIEDRFRRGMRAASGYLDFARGQQEAGVENTAMRLAAIRELQRLTDDDELIDAMYDADMRDQRREDEEETKHGE